MKMLRSFFWIIGIAFTSLVFTSCLDNDGYSLGDFSLDVVTVIPLEGNSFYLKQDDGSKLWPGAPVNINYEAKHGQRALVNYTLLSDSLGGYDHYIKINTIQDVLTKAAAENLGAKNDSVYGTDPITVERMYIGDGYLNMMFGFNTGGTEAHFINLVKSADPNTPYVVEFRHNAYKDPVVAGRTGIVSFNLSSLPDTKGKKVDLVVRVKTFQGDREYKLEYSSGAVPEAVQKNLSLPDTHLIK